MKKLLLFILMLFGLLMSSNASNETYSRCLRGSDIHYNAQLAINAQHYDRLNWNVSNPFVRVRLYLAEDRYVIHSSNENIVVTYDITLTGNNIPSITLTDTLNIGYRQNSPYRDLDMNEYQNYKAASLKITSNLPNIAEDIVFELQLCYPRFTKTDSVGTPFDLRRKCLESTNELLLTWGYLDGADEYDLEWLFVDNPTMSNNVSYDFANATRITTSNNYYKIPLAYPKGNILCRVRGRGTYVNGEHYPVFGPWSFTTPSDSIIPDSNHICRYDFAGLEDSLTWQYTAVYAEDGKRKEVITFYDGSLRSRQEVTVLNTDSIAVVGETFYDHIGRQALQALPSPTPSRGIRYYGTNGTDVGLFNGYFPKSQYDYDVTLTHNQMFPANAGSALYYSSNNPFANHPHWPNVNQTPWDSGYTYTHVRYLNDGTDRIHSQSTVGNTFKMGKGRETRYFYGNPSQAELDRLFGNEVGDASHYQKVLAVDANGEVTVSYYDMKERLIASAIVPSADTSLLLSVDSTPTAHDLYNTIVFDDNSRQYIQNIVVGESASYYFDYEILPPDAFCDTCHENTGCIDCRYTVVFSLWNPETLSHIFKDSLVVSSGTTLSHNVHLEPGSYQLYKSVTFVNDDDIAEAAFDQYRDRQRRCVQYTPAPIHPCYTPCEEYAMEVADIDKPDPTNPTYVQTLAECENPPQSFNTECEAKRAAMLADMSPGGQYFDNIRTCCPSDTDCLCETKPNDFLKTICAKRFDGDAVLEHLQELSGDYSFGDVFWNYMRENWKPGYAEVMLKYHPEYHLYMALCDCGDAEAQHYYDSVFMNTYTYESALELGLLNPLGMDVNENIDIQNSNETGYQPFKAVMNDPFFSEETACCKKSFNEMYNSMVGRLFSYLSWEDHYASLWWLLFDPAGIAEGQHIEYSEEIEDMMVDFQRNIVGQWAENYHCSDNDARWLLFKSIYTYLKDEIRRTVLPGCLLDCSIETIKSGKSCCYDPDFQWGQGDWWIDYFGTCSIPACQYYLAANSDCQAMPLTAGRCSDFEKGGFQIRFLCNPVYGMELENIQEASDSSLQMVYQNCCEDCEAYAKSWMDELNDYFITHCPEFISDSTKRLAFRQKLVSLCVESCDSSRVHRDFSISQRIDLDSLAQLLGDSCFLDNYNYPRVIYPRPQNMYVDCGCDNYQSVLHTYGLTFWDEPSYIADSLALEGITADENDISQWNHFCIWTRYDNMLNGIDDTATLYSNHFPEQFRCYPDLPDSVLCHQQAILAAAAQDTISFYRVLDSLVTAHRAQYTSHCMDNVNERLTVRSSSVEFLYTLYYYDQADNLIKTVPPEGVHVIDNQTTLDAVAAYRNNVARYDTIQTGFIRPNHTMVTNYRYNTLNQVIQSYQPDYDSVSYVYYDILSRPILSQDGKQKPQRKYSYTDYDDLGRIKEVGQVTNSTPFSRNDAATLNFITAFLNNGVKSEVTFTWYDRPVLSTLNQTHLRNRIAAVSFCPDGDSLNPESATHYSYDIHGNVKKLIQDIPALSSFGRRFTSLDYEYDLISGNVNRVWYQKGKLEQFSHRYRYDADNRITHVYTSNIFKIKMGSTISQERLEARYFYLPTGALSRAELGHKQIQGVDYAYTLQGWLKDINGYRCGYYDIDAMSANYDIGEDAFVSAGNQNRLFAHDGFSTSIQYYTDDYEPISGGNFFNEQSANAVPLYNGNISALTTSYYQLWIPSMLKLFRYDKLNRIKSMQTAAHSFSPTGWESVSDNYSTQYSYDWNGNLLFLRRKSETGQTMHQIDHLYPNNENNRLGGITAMGIQSSTYQYDALGNLIRDNAEGLTVSWNALGKVDTIRRNGSLLSAFRYSPTGQRQVKASSSDTIFYIHDATGNVMCIYQLKGDTLTASERYIYGSKRLGMLGQQVWITANGVSGMHDNSTIGIRTYELTDHLGNVTFTFLDRKTLVQNPGCPLVYVPFTVSYTDYYPFGYPIPERSFYIGGYRYFFNGQEADNEVLGEGTLHAFEYRMHDTRIGRFWSVDPLAAKFPWNSTYAFAENSPIGFLELEGLETVRFGSKVVNFTGMSKEHVKSELKKYDKYHHGNISANEIMSTANDNEFWDVTDMKNVYMRSIGTCIEKHSGTQVTTDIRQRWYQWMTVADARLDGGYDGANQGTITSKDWVVGLGFVSAITGIGEIAAAGEATVGVVIGLVNSLDDAFGIFTKGSGSLSQDLTPKQAKVVTNSVKTILSTINTACSVYNLKNKETDKAIGVLNAILSGIGTTSNAKNTVEDARKKD